MHVDYIRKPGSLVQHDLVQYARSAVAVSAPPANTAARIAINANIRRCIGRDTSMRNLPMENLIFSCDLRLSLYNKGAVTAGGWI